MRNRKSQILNRKLPFFKISASLCLCGLILFSACKEIEQPKPEPFYAETTPPPKQELRWSNGNTPKSFDPAKAAAAPEIDVVNALFEGLTEIDAKTLNAVPAGAEKWMSSDDFKTWTFDLRKDAKWSNGSPVTAGDFVRSWRRLAQMGEAAAHNNLLHNISGVKDESDEISAPDFIVNEDATSDITLIDEVDSPSDAESTNVSGKFGVTALGPHTLRASLRSPDKDFPRLVAASIFRPVFGDGSGLDRVSPETRIVSNGPFVVSEIKSDRIVLDRSTHYWNKSAVRLERIYFIAKETAEQALDAYRAGEIDIVTNIEFEPLALKLLEPYKDFRRTTHGALNFYEFNVRHAPFDDRRVREALAISIGRGRLTEGEMEGSTKPALGFLPFPQKNPLLLKEDIARARVLLQDAGFADGKDFPKLRLLVNRNDTQQRVARAVARMWKQNLNLDTEIIVKELEGLESARKNGDFDLIRRGVVMPTADEMVNISSIFGGSVEVDTPPDGAVPLSDIETITVEKEEPNSILATGDDAIFALRAIPLYFPMSYSLVKPYVHGFELSVLGSHSLKGVAINGAWQAGEK